jgi:hypothetical protein
MIGGALAGGIRPVARDRIDREESRAPERID